MLDNGASMTDQFFPFLKGTIDGRPLIAMINAALRDFSKKGCLPFFLSVGTQVRNPTDSGLPTSTEADDLNKWEDEVDFRLM